MNKLKILFFAADPLSAEGRERRLLLDEEARKIKEEVLAAIHRDRVEVETCWATRIKDMRRALNRFQPDIVHFSGHGGANGLVLVSSTGRGPQHADAAALKEFFTAYRGRIRLVVLNACHSRPQAEAIAKAVGCAIGTSSAIQDDAAIHFSAAFYSSIASGHAVQTAFAQACATLKMEKFPDGEAPALEHREDVDPEGLVLIQPVALPPPRRVGKRAVWVVAALLSCGGFYYWVRPDPACAPAREVQGAVTAAGTSPQGRLGLLHAADSTDPLRGPRELVRARQLHQAGNHDADFPLFKEAAEAGHPEAMTSLGLAYLRGLGTPVQPDSGIRWLREAAEKGDPRGMTELGNAYLKREGVDRDLDHFAKHWFQKAADQGYAEAMRNLGTLYREGRGVERQDGERALQLYDEAARAGFVDAMVDAGWMYEEGLAVPRDARQAQCWYSAAADVGSARGKVAIGRLAENAMVSGDDSE